jgi:hypothetical protein
MHHFLSICLGKRKLPAPSRLTSGISYDTLIRNEMVLLNMEYSDSGQFVRGKVKNVGEKGYRQTNSKNKGNYSNFFDCLTKWWFVETRILSH